ncbi:putative transcriptional regulator [Sinobacterium caligoides]|uniref:Putative transcriptional regulator n=1 Tax=Sinobacterium caligoides TaxID=933926 RepID=A0A3N2DDV6_9GAMM|nr:BlaI/MecI/CopY family transcriptional regulator [Sinobacterium caligoides]ROR97980.1 putative transcriptional regulator [Sinobacterium caligoides]
MQLHQLPDLSRAEHDIFQVLWQHGQQSIREVHDQLDNDWAYSTTKTVMDRLTKKGLLSRDNFHGVFLYRAMIDRPTGLAKRVRYFAERVLKLDHTTVIALLAQRGELSSEEINKLRRLIELDIQHDNAQ